MPAAKNFLQWQMFPNVGGRVTCYHTALSTLTPGQQLQNLSGLTCIGAWGGTPRDLGAIPNPRGYLASVRDCLICIFPADILPDQNPACMIEIPAPNGLGSTGRNQILNGDMETPRSIGLTDLKAQAIVCGSAWNASFFSSGPVTGTVIWGYTYWFGHQVGNPAFVQSTVWFDMYGDHVMTHIPMHCDTDAIVLAILACSNAGTHETVRGAYRVTPYIVPSVLSNYSIFDQADLVFACADSTETTVVLPMPANSVFLPDGVTVDRAAIGALIAAFTTSGTNKHGSAITRFSRGRKHSLRRTERGG